MSGDRPTTWDETAGRFPERPAADPDRACEHHDFDVLANVGRILEHDDDPTVAAFVCELRIRCANCGEQFRFMGVPVGVLTDRPAVSLDEFELRAPIRPASSDPDFGLGLPGFSVTLRDERGGE